MGWQSLLHGKMNLNIYISSICLEETEFQEKSEDHLQGTSTMYIYTECTSDYIQTNNAPNPYSSYLNRPNTFVFQN